MNSLILLVGILALSAPPRTTVSEKTRVKSLYEKGRQAFQTKDFELAHKSWKNAIAISSNELEVNQIQAYISIDLGDLVEKQKNYSEAETSFKTALKLNSDKGLRGVILNKLGSICLLQRRTQEAENTLNEALSENNKFSGTGSTASAISLSLLGDLYYIKKQSRESRKYFREALETINSFGFPENHLLRISIQNKLAFLKAENPI